MVIGAVFGMTVVCVIIFLVKRYQKKQRQREREEEGMFTLVNHEFYIYLLFGTVVPFSMQESSVQSYTHLDRLLNEKHHSSPLNDPPTDTLNRTQIPQIIECETTSSDDIIHHDRQETEHDTLPPEYTA